jgi:hypothetical protein
VQAAAARAKIADTALELLRARRDPGSERLPSRRETTPPRSKLAETAGVDAAVAKFLSSAPSLRLRLDNQVSHLLRSAPPPSPTFASLLAVVAGLLPGEAPRGLLSDALGPRTVLALLHQSPDDEASLGAAGKLLEALAEDGREYRGNPEIQGALVRKLPGDLGGRGEAGFAALVSRFDSIARFGGAEPDALPAAALLHKLQSRKLPPALRGHGGAVRKFAEELIDDVMCSSDT